MVAVDNALSAKDAAKRVGLSYPLLDAWARGVNPVVAPQDSGKGRGRQRRYLYRDLIALRVADELRLIGVRTNVIRAVVDYVKNEVKRIDSADEVERHAGAWIGVTCRRGKIVSTFTMSTPAKATRGALDGATVLVDVITIARQLRRRGNRNSRSTNVSNRR